MTIRTWKHAEFDAFLDSEYPAAQDGATEARAVERQERNETLKAFPYSVLLEVSYPEMDFANRWCWQQFGPAHGACLQLHSDYPVCLLKDTHIHDGRWTTHWFAKTAYDYGYNEWYFADQADRDRFVEYLPHVSWGELYPKPVPPS
jgi:hypothetical protein